MLGDADEGTASFTAKDSTITTNKGDTYITSLENADSTNSNINFNGYKLYVNEVEVK